MNFSKIKKALVLAIILAIPTIAAAQLLSANRLDRSIWLLDNMTALFGDRPDSAIGYNTAQTNDALMIGVSTDSRALHISDYGDLSFNFANANFSNPSLVVHSANQATDEWVRLYHDGTNAGLATGKGSIFFPQGIFSTDVYATGNFILEGSTADANETSIAVVDPTLDRTITLPNANGHVVVASNITINTGANLTCNTSCGAADKCMFGFDGGTSSPVLCNAASAEFCFCVAQ